MNKLNRILWGLVFMLVGLALAAKATGLTDFELFFDGWWTLFIIVPCTVDLFTKRNKLSHLGGVLLGVVLLLCCQGVLSFHTLWQLVLPAALLLIGAKLVFGTLFQRRVTIKQLKEKGRPIQHASAIFSGNELNLAGETIEGAELTAVFGGLEYDLRDAVITQDCVIHATAVFGGIDIRLPSDVNVKVMPTALFGGVDNTTVKKRGDVTVYITATALFGGVDIS